MSSSVEKNFSQKICSVIGGTIREKQLTLFCNNLTAKFNTKQARFYEINRNLNSS